MQLTADAFVERVLSAGAAMSMDGRGRWLDNRFIERLWRSYKYEDVYLRAYQSPDELEAGTGKWLAHYNERRPHQALGYRTPLESYLSSPPPKSGAIHQKDFPPPAG